MQKFKLLVMCAITLLVFSFDGSSQNRTSKRVKPPKGVKETFIVRAPTYRIKDANLMTDWGMMYPIETYFPGNPLNYSDSDAMYKVICLPKTSPKEGLYCYTVENNGVVDTMAFAYAAYQFTTQGWMQDGAIEPNLPYNDAVKTFADYKESYDKAKKMTDDLLSRLHTMQEREKTKLAEAKQKQIEDSLARIERDKQAAIEAARWQEERTASTRKHILGTLDFEFTEPTEPIQTMTITKASGVQVTYQYYLNEHGGEVYHGKKTSTMTFENYKYWRGYDVGFVYITGTETLTETYRNGILHGPMKYERKTSTQSTFGNPRTQDITYDFDIYKGFLNGDFNFSSNGAHFKGKAINGILEYCDYRTNDGIHGQLTSNPNNPNSLSMAQLKNTFTELYMIHLPASVVMTIPQFRFPLIGSN